MILNTLIVVYTIFALPLYVAYGIEAKNTMVVIFEIAVSVISALHIYLKLNSFKKKRNTIKTKHLYLHFIFKTDFLFDFIGVLPLYLLLSKIFWFFIFFFHVLNKFFKSFEFGLFLFFWHSFSNLKGLDSQPDDSISIIDLLKILRIIQVFHLSSLMRTIQNEYRSLYTLISLLKSLVYLVIVIHWTSCFWFWIDYKVNFPLYNS